MVDDFFPWMYLILTLHAFNSFGLSFVRDAVTSNFSVLHHQTDMHYIEVISML